MIRRPPRPTLFPSTPLFRSERGPPGCGRPQPAAGPAAAARAVRRRAAGAVRRSVPAGTGTGRRPGAGLLRGPRSEEHTSELQSRQYLVCRLLLEKKNNTLLTRLVSSSLVVIFSISAF